MKTQLATKKLTTSVPQQKIP